MTVMQLMMQPFGIMNALREKFIIPVSATAALAAAVCAPKSTGLYKLCVRWLTNLGQTLSNIIFRRVVDASHGIVYDAFQCNVLFTS